MGWMFEVRVFCGGCSEASGSAFLDLGVHADLVLAEKSVHKTKKFVARSGVHDEVDPW